MQLKVNSSWYSLLFSQAIIPADATMHGGRGEIQCFCLAVPAAFAGIPLRLPRNPNANQSARAQCPLRLMIPPEASLIILVNINAFGSMSYTRFFIFRNSSLVMIVKMISQSVLISYLPGKNPNKQMDEFSFH